MKKSRRHSLGQHFLRDKKVLQEIIRLIDPQPGEVIVEIGPGTGVLTVPLIASSARIIVIERDSLLIPGLQKLPQRNLSIIQGDAVRISLPDIIGGTPAKLAGNLPYSISGPFLFRVFQAQRHLTRCVFLLQKEFAERICAESGSKKYAPLSILLANHFIPKLQRIIPPGAFTPPPQVDSALVSLEKRPAPQAVVTDEMKFASFLRLSFRHRRKKLANNLKSGGFPEKDIRGSYEAAALPEDIRAEQVTLSQFVCLFTVLSDQTPVNLPFS